MLCGRARHPLANHKLSAPFHATTMALPLVRTALLAGRAHAFSAPRKRTWTVTIPPELEAPALLPRRAMAPQYHRPATQRPSRHRRQLARADLPRHFHFRAQPPSKIGAARV